MENTCTCTFDQILSMERTLSCISGESNLTDSIRHAMQSYFVHLLCTFENIILELFGEDKLHDDKEFQHQWKNYLVKTLRRVYKRCV